MYSKSSVSKKINLKVIWVEVINFNHKTDNFMIESGVQHIKINYLNVKQLPFFQKNSFTGAIYATKNILSF